MTGSLKIGLVGFGKIARDQHLPAIAATQGLELVAIASRNARLEDVANYPDITAMLAAEPVLDAVILCQPPQVRYEAARAALLAGKHVFLEKPPGATLSEVEALRDLAATQALTLFASWHSRYAAFVAQAKAWLIGRTLLDVQIIWKEDVRHWHPGQDWIWRAGGFGVFDPGINALSIITEILPESVRVVEAELETPANRQAPIAARMTMATASGVPVRAEFDWRQTGPQHWDISIETQDGVLRLGNGGNSLSVAGTDWPPCDDLEYRSMYARFAELIGAGAYDVDISPISLVADAFLCGRNVVTEPFED